MNWPSFDRPFQWNGRKVNDTHQQKNPSLWLQTMEIVHLVQSEFGHSAKGASNKS